MKLNVSPHSAHTGLVHSEEVVGQKLLDLEGQKSQMMRELEKVEQEAQQSLAESHTLDSEIQYPSDACSFCIDNTMFAVISFVHIKNKTSNNLRSISY